MNKKIAFIDHSFHVKTKSSSFFVESLKEKYELDIYYDSYWHDKKPFDFINLNKKNYYVIIFWQINYSVKYLKKLICKNIIYIPMYDDFIANTITPFYWKQFSNIKFITFSKILHNYLIKRGLKSFYIQYFPNIKENNKKIDVKNLIAFFWYRIELINWDIIKKLITKNTFKKIYIQNHPDPNQKELNISKEDIEKYNIEFVDWFESKEEYLDLLKSIDIYLAPREYEGIGLSFLEAMSYGKYIIALNESTMNEYIINGINGYLYSLENPKEINLKEINYNKLIEINKNYFKEYFNRLDSLYEFIEHECNKEKNIVINKYYYFDKILRVPFRIFRKIVKVI